MNKVIDNVLLIIIGDIHGDFERFIKLIASYDLRNCVLIQAGDFGIGFKTLKKDLATMKYMNKFLKNRNIILYAIRGNHDNPEFFNPEKYKYSNITMLRDYSTIILGDGKKILCAGGAVSIDRLPNLNEKDMYGKPWPGRTEGKSYWKNEIFVLDEKKLQEVRDVDIVITHSAPNFCFPTGVKGSGTWINNDPTLYDDLMTERENLARMFEILKNNGNKLSHWYYGHFHNSHKQEHEGTEFVLLDIDEFQEIRYKEDLS